jgi:hypothetical protein
MSNNHINTKTLRRFFDLPLGTQFRYPFFTTVWVVLSRHDCGEVAKWEGADASPALQSICSFADSEHECRTMEVEVAEPDSCRHLQEKLDHATSLLSRASDELKERREHSEAMDAGYSAKIRQSEAIIESTVAANEALAAALRTLIERTKPVFHLGPARSDAEQALKLHTLPLSPK